MPNNIPQNEDDQPDDYQTFITNRDKRDVVQQRGFLRLCVGGLLVVAACIAFPTVAIPFTILAGILYLAEHS